MKKIELLAPAGNRECFEAALLAGADAIYLGGKMFGARNYAGNFELEELEELEEVVKKAHLYHVKIYVTVNTAVYEAEVPSFLRYVDKLVEIHVDALILQDLGMVDLLHQLYPNLEIHASTQMHIHTLEGVQIAEKLGCKRAVLARELTIEEILKIKKKSSADLEVFGHGALCASYSGQCYMSYMVGGRSGNRGTCSQCCRKKYQVLESGKKKNAGEYPLSMKDLCTLENIGTFIDSGICSIKIEGRMKRPEYVYLVTSLYRKAIDFYYQKGFHEVTEEEKKELYKIFNRQFTKGFLFGEERSLIVHDKRPNHMGMKLGNIVSIEHNGVEIRLIDTLSIGDGIRVLNEEKDAGMAVYSLYKNGKQIEKGHPGEIVKVLLSDPVSIGDEVCKTTDAEQMETIHACLKEEKRMPISMTCWAEVGKPLQIEIGDGSVSVTVHGDILLESAKNAPISKEELADRLGKLGNTIYRMDKLSIHMIDSLFIPVKEINEVRRRAITKWMDHVLERKPLPKGKYHREVPTFRAENIFSVYVHSKEQYAWIKDENVSKIYAEESLAKDIQDKRIFTRTPRVAPLYENQKEPLLITEIGGLSLTGSKDSDFSFNVTNSYTVALLHDLGVEDVTVSYECNPYQVKKIMETYEKRYLKKPRLSVIVYGRSEVMILKYNLLERYDCKKASLVDEFRNAYIVENNDNYITIYDYKKREEDYKPYFDMGVSNVRYHLTDE